MLKTAARILLLRVLPRRILPIVTVIEALLFLRSVRNRSRVKVNRPTKSRTPTPTPTPTSTPTSSPTSTPSPTSTDRPTPA